MNSVFLAFTLSFLAGAASAVGGLCSFFIKKENLSALAVGLGFSAGVMIYVSFMEILPHAQETLVGLYGHVFGPWLAVGLFFVGVAIAWGVDRCLPPLHVKEETLKQSAKLKQTGLFTLPSPGFSDPDFTISSSQFQSMSKRSNVTCIALSPFVFLLLHTRTNCGTPLRQWNL